MINNTILKIIDLGYNVKICKKANTIAFMKEESPTFIISKSTNGWELETLSYRVNSEELNLLNTLIKELEKQEKIKSMHLEQGVMIEIENTSTTVVKARVVSVNKRSALVILENDIYKEPIMIDRKDISRVIEDGTKSS